ncbi:MAG: hypothetical protein HC834_03625 [Rhodospirillales bacterium]|nr:hypothetical protein [Rhodospirillales bacterium]
MAESKTFTDVTPHMWERLQTLGREKHGTEFHAHSETHGQASTATPLGKLVLEYAHNPKEATVTYTIVSKPMFVMSPIIWNGIETALKGLRDDGSA